MVCTRWNCAPVTTTIPISTGTTIPRSPRTHGSKRTELPIPREYAPMGKASRTTGTNNTVPYRGLFLPFIFSAKIHLLLRQSSDRVVDLLIKLTAFASIKYNAISITTYISKLTLFYFTSCFFIFVSVHANVLGSAKNTSGLFRRNPYFFIVRNSIRFFREKYFPNFFIFVFLDFFF